jgi:hypothetical protein
MLRQRLRRRTKWVNPSFTLGFAKGCCGNPFPMKLMIKWINDCFIVKGELFMFGLKSQKKGEIDNDHFKEEFEDLRKGTQIL